CIGVVSEGLKAFTELSIGYYAWLLSFGMVTAGALHLAMRRPNAFVSQKPTVTGRTKDELEAISELEAYLNGEPHSRELSEPIVEVTPRSSTEAIEREWNPQEVPIVNRIDLSFCPV